MGWVSDDAWIIVQIHPIEYKSLEFLHFKEFEQRKYGSTILVFYERLQDS
jgi:16S rRNA (guanine966-N2)-methyltransferase